MSCRSLTRGAALVVACTTVTAVGATAEPDSVAPTAPGASAPPAASALPAASAEAPRAEAAPESPAPVDPEELELYEGSAEVEAPPREPTRRALEARDLSRMPGARGDAFRAIEVLPGVGRSTVTDGRPVLRGAAQFESQSFIEGVPVPLLFHFGGLTSVYATRLLDRVTLMPGNFGVRYGRVSGGVIEATVRPLRLDAWHGALELSLLDSSAMVEAPIGARTAVALAARRSNIDAVYSALVPKDAFGVVAAPVYWDYQGVVDHAVSDRHQLRVLAYGSRDSLRLLFDRPNEDDPLISGDVRGLNEFHRVQLVSSARLGGGVDQRLSVALGQIDIQQRVGDLDFVLRQHELFARGDWSFELAPDATLRAGFDFDSNRLDARYAGPAVTQLEGDPRVNQSGLNRDRIELAQERWIISPAVYLEAGLRPVSGLQLIPGVRIDRFQQLRHTTADPRFAARYALTDTATLKGGAGQMTQAPEFWQALPVLGNPGLRPYRALQLAAGVEWAPSRRVKLGLEYFEKHLRDRVVGSADGSAPRFINAGTGTIRGAEAAVELRPDDDTFLIGAYTISRSTRVDRGEAERLFDLDQTHVLSVAASRGLGKGWEVGFRFRYVSGNPETPIVGATWDGATDLYRPRYGAINSTRTPAFHQLDVRVEKRWRIGRGSIAAYLDLQNAYANAHREGTRYSYDYRRSAEVTGLPILPNIGVRGEL